MDRRSPEEISLWQSFIEGNDLAFSLIYNQYTDQLYAYGKRYLADDDQILDCIQELFLDLYKYRKTLAVHTNVKFYLLSALKHKVFKAIRQTNKGQICLSSYDYLNSCEFAITFNAEEVLIRNEEYTEYLKTLLKEMNMLPVRQKEILYLRYTSNLEYEEIAFMLNISVASCRTLVCRGIKKLRLNLEKSYSKNHLLLLSIIFWK